MVLQQVLLYFLKLFVFILTDLNKIAVNKQLRSKSICSLSLNNMHVIILEKTSPMNSVNGNASLKNKLLAVIERSYMKNKASEFSQSIKHMFD